MNRPGHEHCETVIESLEREIARLTQERDGLMDEKWKLAALVDKRNHDMQRLTALVAVGETMTTALHDYQVALEHSKRSFSEKAPGIMHDFLGGMTATLTGQMALATAMTECATWRAMREGTT